ncbi:copper amine oxidase N-terminal domain-containing protein [Peribacillus sp. NPDC097197]|uniref:copper amine oxidase N-terminal domain-containing protein n=1 Tax=Peribacillus sp. NPDC097197 TaxID=3390615 RepID=UPI003D081E3F
MTKNLKISEDTQIHMNTIYRRNGKGQKANMKRRFSHVFKGMLISSILIGSVFTSGIYALANSNQEVIQPTSAATSEKVTYTNIKTVIEGKTKSFKQSSIYSDGKVLVPMSDVFKEFGAKIKTDKKAKTMTATKGKTVITVTEGSKAAKINSKSYKMAVKATSINGTMMVSTSLISKLTPVKSTYNKTKKTVTIVKVKQKVVKGILVKHGNHTYESKNQKEYDMVMSAVKSALDKDFNKQYLGGSKESSMFYNEYIQGARWDGDRSNRSSRNIDLKQAEGDIGELVENNVSVKEIEKAYKTMSVALDLSSNKKDPGTGAPRSAYDNLFRGLSDCDASAQVIIAVFDQMGYDTTIVGGNNHADPYIKIGGDWYVTSAGSFFKVLNFNLNKSGTYVLAAPTSGKF